MLALTRSATTGFGYIVHESISFTPRAKMNAHANCCTAISRCMSVISMAGNDEESTRTTFLDGNGTKSCVCADSLSGEIFPGGQCAFLLSRGGAVCYYLRNGLMDLVILRSNLYRGISHIMRFPLQMKAVAKTLHDYSPALTFLPS